MNPLMLADWKRVNRVFVRVMWVVAAILACAVCIASVPASGHAHQHHAASTATLARTPPAH